MILLKLEILIDQSLIGRDTDHQYLYSNVSKSSILTINPDFMAKVWKNLQQVFNHRYKAKP